MITVQLPEDLETALHAEVQSGRFASVDDVIAMALRRLLNPPPPKGPLTEVELLEYLRHTGMISELPNTSADFDDPDDELIEIEGEPLSETVIRGRR
jgi:Arc/MetJ-type ribon-helix-helix transcriptional regulator